MNAPSRSTAAALPPLTGDYRVPVSTASDLTLENNVVTLDRRGRDRRSEKSAVADGGETKTPRRKKQRRRHIDPTTCERDYNDEEILFMRAMDDYKRTSGRMFPTCSEVLEVIRGLGYVKLNDEQLARVSDDASAVTCDDECV